MTIWHFFRLDFHRAVEQEDAGKKRTVWCGESKAVTSHRNLHLRRKCKAPVPKAVCAMVVHNVQNGHLGIRLRIQSNIPFAEGDMNGAQIHSENPIRCVEDRSTALSRIRRMIGRNQPALPFGRRTRLTPAENPIPTQCGKPDRAGVLLPVATGLISTRIGSGDRVMAVFKAVAGDP